MKHFLKLTLAAALLLACNSNAFAQKFGYIKSEELVTMMPEHAEAQKQFSEFQAELISQLDNIRVEFNTKAEELQANEATYSEAMKQAKNRELSEIEQRYMQRQESISSELDQMQNTLMAPIIDKALKAIDDVGKAEGFTFIFDRDNMLYVNTSTVIDIMPIVKQKLGIAADATPPTAAR